MLFPGNYVPGMTFTLAFSLCFFLLVFCGFLWLAFTVLAIPPSGLRHRDDVTSGPITSRQGQSRHSWLGISFIH